jgi:hypothetical protein
LAQQANAKESDIFCHRSLLSQFHVPQQDGSLRAFKNAKRAGCWRSVGVRSQKVGFSRLTKYQTSKMYMVYQNAFMKSLCVSHALAAREKTQHGFDN